MHQLPDLPAAHAAEQRQRQREEQAAGDGIYWPLFNLDIKNPNTVDEGHEDPDVLLARYAEAVEQLQGKGNGEYIGRVTMDILAHKLAQEDAIGNVPSVGCAWSPGNTA